MAVSDVFSAHLLTGYLPPVYPNDPVPIYEDITSGIIGVDIQFGTDVYEGPYQQIDTGLFTLVSRNPDLDPKNNSNIVEGNIIEFRDSRNAEEGKTNVFFQGFITDIDVQYQRKDDPIITITGTDTFGLLQRTVVSDDLRSFGLGYASGIVDDPDENGPNLNTLVNSEAWFQNSPIEINIIDPLIAPSVPGAIDPALPYDTYLGYSPARYLPDLGETLLEILNNYTQTNLNYCSINFRQTPQIIDVYPYAKYNPFFWPPMSDPALEFPTLNFSSDPADGRPYESILINNGYNRRSKALAISNETRTIGGTPPNETIESTSINYPPYKVNESDTSVATGLDTIFATSFVDNDSVDLYAQDIFQVVNFGSDEIQQITFDNARFEDVQNDYTYSFSQLNQFIRIKHQLTENQTIDRFYDIAGITHNITPDKWEMGFTFKPAQNEIAFTYQGQEPTIQMNSLTGDSNFNFTATITDFPTEDIAQVIWCLNGTNSNVNEQWTFTVDGSRYKDGLQRNGLTQTWNFDDDGILEGPDFPTGGYGTGEWYVIPYIILKNGWVIAPHVMLTVGTPSVDADFFWTQNLTNNFGQVTFTDDSHNNETGEPDSYLWNFGDGNTSTLQNPVHIYDPAPDQTTYSVSLRVFAYGVGGAQVFNTRTKTVTLARPTMTPNFTWIASNNIVTFTNTSTNVGFEEPDAYFWEFGDGTTSTLKNPVKTFAAQQSVPTNYSVKLTTRNIWEQTANVTKTVTVDSIYTSGTLPVTQVRVQSAGGDGSGLMMSYLRCLRSDGANLSFNANTVSTTDPGEVFWQYTGASGPQVAPTSGTGLTRNILLYPNEGGLQWRGGGSTPGFLTNTTVSTTQNMNSINMRFDDPGSFQGNSYGRYYANVNDSFGGYYPIGYWDFANVNPNPAPRQNFGRDYAMTPIRPMPPKIPYFKYTFDNRTVSFTSVETADSYAWTFGDGTTSTVKNPVKTYAAKGTYTVTLAVTNGGVVTRTTTEPVIVEALVGFPVRYIRFGQKNYTGINAWDTPFIFNFRPMFNRNTVQQTTPLYWFDTSNSTSFAKTETYSMQWVGGTADTNPPNIIDPLSSAAGNNTRLYSGGGIRTKSLDGTFRSQWQLFGDFGTTPVNNITEFRADFSRWSNYDGTPNPVCAGISYEVFVTDYLGNPAGIGTATWTKIGDFTPTGMPLNNNKDYQMIPL